VRNPSPVRHRPSPGCPIWTSTATIRPAFSRSGTAFSKTKDIQAAKERLFDRLENTAFEDRVYEFHDEMIREMYDEAEAAVLAKIKTYDSGHLRNQGGGAATKV